MYEQSEIERIKSDLQLARAEINALREMVTRDAGPYRRVFLAARTGGGQFQEHTVANGEVVEWMPGGRKCDDDAHPAAILPSDAVGLMEFEDFDGTGTRVRRYVQISASPGVWMKTTAIPTNGGNHVTLAKLWDGTVVAGEAVPVYCPIPTGVDVLIWVTQPNGGTPAFWDDELPGSTGPARVVRLGTVAGPAFGVNLGQDGGADNVNGGTATYTYTATVNGRQIGTGLAPSVPRVPGSRQPATRGIARYVQPGDTLELIQAFEPENTTEEGCAGTVI